MEPDISGSTDLLRRAGFSRKLSISATGLEICAWAAWHREEAAVTDWTAAWWRVDYTESLLCRSWLTDSLASERCPLSKPADVHGEHAFHTFYCGLLGKTPLLASKSWPTSGVCHASWCILMRLAWQLSQQQTWRGRALSKGETIFVVGARTKGLSGSIPALSASNTDAGGLQ